MQKNEAIAVPRPKAIGGSLRAALLLFSTAHFSEHLTSALMIPMLPFIKDYFALNYLQTGMVVSAYSITAGAANLPMGWLADRIGRAVVLALGMIGVALAGIAIGLSNAYFQVLVFAVLLGLFTGAYHPVSAALLGGFAGPSVRGRVLGLHQIGGSVAVASAPALGGLLATVFDWRWAFWLMAIPALLVAPIVLLLGRGYEANIGEGRAKQGQKAEGSLLQTLKPVLLVLALSSLSGIVVMAGIQLIPLFMADVRGISKGYAAASASLVFAFDAVSATIGGWLADKIGRKPTIIISIVAAGPVLLLVSQLAPGPALILALLALSPSNLLRAPAVQSMIVDVVPASRRSTVFGAFFFFSAETRSILVPVLGVAADRIGLMSTFTGVGLVAIGFSALSLVLWVLWRRRM